MFVVGAAGSDMLQTGEGRGRGRGRGQETASSICIHCKLNLLSRKKKKDWGSAFPEQHG